MQIRELARATGVPAKTIRYYESVGLLPPPARTANNYRQYAVGDVARLRFIASARRLGIAIAEIGAVLAARDQGVAPCDQVLTVLDTQLAQLDQRIAELLELRADLAQIRAVGAQLPRDDVVGAHCVCALVSTYGANSVLRQDDRELGHGDNMR
jgi:DNA-binding transcriptional MerR regulator